MPDYVKILINWHIFNLQQIFLYLFPIENSSALCIIFYGENWHDFLKKRFSIMHRSCKIMLKWQCMYHIIQGCSAELSLTSISAFFVFRYGKSRFSLCLLESVRAAFFCCPYLRQTKLNQIYDMPLRQN